MRAHVVAASLSILLAGCLADDATLPAAAVVGLPPLLDVDATAPGPYAVEVSDYDWGRFTHTEQGLYTLPLRGELYLPSDAERALPVVILQHGRHPTCEGLPFLPVPILRQTRPPECPDAVVVSPVESFRGYGYLAENLAGHGYAVLSVDANPVNAMDGAHDELGTSQDAGGYARADIVLRTLDELRARNDEEFGGSLDLTRVGLMGHSRGGEGVVLALQQNLARPESERHSILAVFALAPIDRNAVVAEGAAFAVILPWCDGDVWTLSGARIFDDTRAVDGFPRTQFLVMGANHNFYNTVWEEGDDGTVWEDDPLCAPEARPTAEEQRAEALAHIAGFMRLHLGGEVALAPLLDGSATLPATACPAAIPCERAVHASHRPSAGFVELTDVATSGFAAESECIPDECETDAHVAGSASRRVLAWTGPAALSAVVPPDAGSVRAVTFRIAFDPAAPDSAGLSSQDLRIEVTDASGRAASTSASARSTALFVVPTSGDDGPAHVVLNEVRIPIAAFAGIDAASVREVRLVFDATPTGRAHVADVGVLLG